MARETLDQKKKRAREIGDRLSKEFPDAETALTHRNIFELLIATILSAQCTDVLVNKVTPDLFKRAPTAQAMASLSVADIGALVQRVNFWRNKAKNIHSCALKLVEDYAGEVPSSRDELIELPGVGRKTANVILTSGFKIPAMVVDTHVLRLSNRLRFSRGKDPVEVESDLESVFDRKVWVHLSHWLILHGRKTCKAGRPLCEKCGIVDLCPSAFKKGDAWKD